MQINKKIVGMANENQPLNKKNKTQANEQFYQLLKELVETQSLIIEKLDKVLESKASEPVKKSAADIWKGL